ncbi:hypothetical protein PRIPAC_86851 [Pristionchus pacificus]|uniref:Uncharacterized protein n=1 Tax=Pristionchus pacificus TaxID=54126 RepID=A0A2A6CCG7_PRIPA|nr:hypothetical protein PRIPAC_86851 [Pristionchus pacificus]|eukprot:PDM75790.1 hypothetical protein PRIPAC_40169 [Pristionchus pacificus]
MSEREELFEQGRARYEEMRATAHRSQGRRVQRVAVHKRVRELREGLDSRSKEKRSLKRMAVTEKCYRALIAIQKRKREEAASRKMIDE